MRLLHNIENLEHLNTTTFKILEFFINDCTRYKLSNDIVSKIPFTGAIKSYNISDISKQHKILLQNILKGKKGRGAFDIDEIQPLIDDLLDGNKLKGSAKNKGDLKTLVYDAKIDNSVNISYNIKSELGAKATLLNASNHTNFIYEVQNINDTIMAQCNNINTKRKLIEKCEFLKSHGAICNFRQIESSIFANNLKLIDSKLDTILAQILILSYEKNTKDIQVLLAYIIKDEISEKYYKKKIGDFANAVTFGMRAGEEWNGLNEVNGGIIIVSKTGEVYLLDLIYFKNLVDKYLIKNIKLDSPSSKRYEMLKIYKKNNKYYFKLNLQIRFK
ncbi:HpaII family restriction endonuclease [Sulfurimonas sp.]